jgi:hypothetical protein
MELKTQRISEANKNLYRWSSENIDFYHLTGLTF